MRQGVELIDDDIVSFQPKRAVKFFRDLVWAIAPNAGIQSDANVNLNIYTPDGGIDAEVENDFHIEVAEAEDAGLIPNGRTGYQIKISKPSKSDCRNELLNSDGNIKSYIEDIATDEGNYVFITFSQLTPEERRERIEEFTEVFEEHGYKNCNVDLFAAGRLVKFANKFPGLVFKYSNVGSVGRDIDTWANRPPINTPKEYIETVERGKALQEIQSILGKSDEGGNSINGCPVVRIIGASGLGKTRLVYEAVKHEQFANRVIYEEADNFEHSELATTLEVDGEREAIIVLDNCSREQHRKFKNQYSSYDRLALITISTDPSEVPANAIFEIHRLETDAVKDILNSEFTTLSDYTIDRIARISDGYPEMAVLLAEEYTENDADQSIVEVSDSTVFDRLLAGDERDAPELRDIKRVLTPFAFFSRIRWSNENDTQQISEQDWLIQTFNLGSDFSQSELSEIIQYAKTRGVLRGDDQLSLDTIPLATYLMEEALERNDRILDSITHQKCPRRLQRSFAERIPYANTHQVTKDWAAETLLRTEWFGEYWSGGLGPIFRALAEIAPDYALEVLETSIDQMDREELRRVEDRRTTLESLRRIAVWEEQFFGAANLLRKLAEAENSDQYINNSTGVFADLFSPQYGPYAPTEVAPEDRYPILEDLLTSQDTEKHRVGLEAAERVLSIDGMVSGGIPQRQGAKPSPDFWVPETNAERIEYFEAVWKLVAENLDRFDDKYFEKGVEILLSNSRKLARSEVLSPIIRDTFENLLSHPDVDDSDVMNATVRIVYYDSDEYSEEMREAWEEFERRITNRNFHSRLKRYVGGRDYIDRSDEREDFTQEKIASLADETIKQPDLIEREIDWLLEASSRSAVDFGQELGKRDDGLELMEIFTEGLYEIDEDAALAVFSGYLQTSLDSIDDAPDGFFDRLRNDDHLSHFFPFLTRRASSSDDAALLILESIKQGDISIRGISAIEPIARSGDLSEDVLMRIADYLLDRNSANALGLLVNLSFDFYRGENTRELNEEIVIQSLTHPDLLDPDSDVTGDGHWYEWEQLTEMLIAYDINRGFEIAESVVDTISNRNNVAASRENIETVFRPLFEEDPERAWKIVAEGLEEKEESVKLESWMAGQDWNKNEPAILSVPTTLLWGWVDEDPEKRAPRLVRCIPSMGHNGWWELVREILLRYGEQEEVFTKLSVFETGTRGTDDLFKNRYERLKKLRQEESHSRVRRWLSREMSHLEPFVDSI